MFGQVITLFRCVHQYELDSDRMDNGVIFFFFFFFSFFFFSFFFLLFLMEGRELVVLLTFISKERERENSKSKT